MDKLIFLNGQWQGGGLGPVTLYGVREIERDFLAGLPHETIPISEDTDLSVEEGVFGLSPILKQFDDARRLLAEKRPERLLTIGADCDGDIASIAYLNARYEGDLTLVWMDAHGDINTPEESSTHLFYGMPIRVLLGDTICSERIERPLGTEQVIQFGGRDLDPPEQRYYQEKKITLIDAASGDPADALYEAVRQKGKRHIYVHFDLDVIDPKDFPDTRIPVEGGLPAEAVYQTLLGLKENFDIVGMGFYEYKPGEANRPFLEKMMRFCLSLWDASTAE